MSGHRLTRRGFVRIGAALPAAAALAACAPAAAPAAPAAPAPGAAGGAPGAAPAWQKEWDELVVAAKKEGKLSLVTTIGSTLREGVEGFKKQFPEIDVEHTQMIASTFAPRALQEQKGGVYSYDVITTTYGTVPLTMIPAGAIDPIRPLLFRGDVLDDKVWRNGFEDGFLDLDKKWGYAAFQEFTRHFWVNTNLVKEGELKGIKDVLDPKWKGKITGGDPRTHGGGWWPASILRLTLKDDTIVKRLWKDQEVTLSRDQRQMMEMLIKDRYAIGIGAVSLTILPEFKQAGLGNNLKMIDMPEADHLNGGSNVVYTFVKRPHPNAAKLFVNWLLTKEGQATWSKPAETNSRRVDVAPAAPEKVAPPGKWIQIDRQEMEPEWKKTQDLAKEALN